MGSSEKVSLPQVLVQWNKCQTNLLLSFEKLLNYEQFVDVTLAVESETIKCHKVVLSASSAYFERILIQNPCPHPVIIMHGMKYWEVLALVNFMYRGEVNVDKRNLDELLKSAVALEIHGLSICLQTDYPSKLDESVNVKEEIMFEQQCGVSEPIQTEKQLNNKTKRKTKCMETDNKVLNSSDSLKKACYHNSLPSFENSPRQFTNVGNVSDISMSEQYEKNIIIKEEVDIMEFSSLEDVTISSSNEYKELPVAKYQNIIIKEEVDIMEFSSLEDVTISSSNEYKELPNSQNIKIKEEVDIMEFSNSEDVTISSSNEYKELPKYQGEEVNIERSLSTVLTSEPEPSTSLEPRCTDKAELQVGDWIVVTYDELVYPGEITSITIDSVQVNVMHPTEDKKKFKWPTPKDMCFYEFEDVLKKISPPIPSSSRAAFFTFNESF